MVNLLDFYRREEKPVWWDIFNKSELHSEDLLDDIDALAFLRSVSRPVVDTKSFTREYRFDPQETKFRKGEYYYLKNTAPEFKSVKVDNIDLLNGRATLRWSQKNGALPINADLIPTGPVNTKKLAESMKRFIRTSTMTEATPFSAGIDLLERKKPSFTAGFDLENSVSADLIEGSIEAIRNMNNTTLAIQGPPGTGKTYLISHAIERLANEGYKIGVASSSHKAIDNVLTAVADVSNNTGSNYGIREAGW